LKTERLLIFTFGNTSPGQHQENLLPQKRTFGLGENPALRKFAASACKPQNSALHFTAHWFAVVVQTGLEVQFKYDFLINW